MPNATLKMRKAVLHIPFSPQAGSNHVSFLLVLWRPFGFSREDGVGENDEFAGDGYDGAQVIL
ncbi:hypothetical protein, partial [Rhizobium lentis]